MNPKIKILFGTGMATALLLAACGGDGGSAESTEIPQPTAAQLKAAELGELPVAPASDRVDLSAPPFSDSTKVTNPLFPISDLHSAILSGRVDGKPFHTETTLLPYTRVIDWSEGQRVETLVSQYVAYLDGRIEEVALDYYAQADDGSVWYFGEDVFNYDEDGVIAHTEGTWLAGKEGPAAMIMPADSKVGDVHRPENIPGLVFEEVEIKTVGTTVDGPLGPVDGAIVGRELHDDGSFSDKTFAPGYGEFFSAHEGDVEAIALAVPTDALDGPPPTELEALSSGADASFDAARSRDWKKSSAELEAMTAAWDAYRAGGVPARLAAEMSRALDLLARAVDARDPTQAGTAAIDVAQSTLDLELRYLPPAEIDRARFELWARQVQVDAADGDLAGVSGDVATLEWIRDRFVHTLDPVDVTAIDTELESLRTDLVDEDLKAAAATSESLREALAGIQPAAL
jgi:hypothetical protein